MNLRKFISFLLLVLITESLLLNSCGSSKADNSTSPAKGAGRLASATTDSEAQTEEPVAVTKNGITICVDPRHGFDDPGTFSDYLGNLCEKDITLAVVKELKAHLELLGYTVVMTHDGESFPKTTAYDDNNKYKPEERVAYANSLGATIDYYISIHCNAFDTEDASGSRIYYYEGPQKTAGYDLAIAQAVAAQVGSVFPEEGVPPIDIFSYYVVTYTQVPACLVEIGFVTNPDDAADMVNPEWQSKYAKALADGIDNYYKANPLQ